MRIAIMAAGGVGGYLGARLVAGGFDVSFIARGSHLGAMKKNGLQLESALGDLDLKDITVTDNPAEIGPVDIVIFTVKLWDNDTAAEMCKPLISDQTAVITFQNGIESIDTLAGILGKSHAVGGAAYISAAIAAPRKIRHVGNAAKFVIGEPDGTPSDRLKSFIDICQQSDIDMSMAENILRVLWEKFTFFAPVSGVTSASRSTLGVAFGDPEMRLTIQAAMQEVISLGQAKGIDLSENSIEPQMAFGDSLPAETKTSVLRDLEEGNRLEIPWLVGAVHRLGVEMGIETPVSSTLYSVLKPHVDGSD
jgi:2-dehydropantoate 2-reductase